MPYTYCGSFEPVFSDIRNIKTLLNVASRYMAVSPITGAICLVSYYLLMYPTAQTPFFRVSIPFGGAFRDTTKANFLGGNIFVSENLSMNVPNCFRSIGADGGYARLVANFNMDPSLFNLGLAVNFSVAYEMNDFKK